jgi:hypothetical protein
MPTTLIRDSAQSANMHSAISILAHGTLILPIILTLVIAKPPC